MTDKIKEIENSIKNIGEIHHVLVNALNESFKKEEFHDENIAQNTFAAIITLAYQINRDFAKGTLSESIAITEPIAQIVDSFMRLAAEQEQAVS